MTDLSIQEQHEARKILAAVPGMAFEINPDKRQTVEDLLDAMTLMNQRLAVLYEHIQVLETEADQQRRDRQATRRFLGLDA